MHIVVDSGIPYIKGVFEPWATVAYRNVIGRDDVAQADAIVVRTRTRCDEGLLSGSRVRMVASATIGVDHIDIDYCRRAGIAVANAPGCNARGVLQWVAAILVHVFSTGPVPEVSGSRRRPSLGVVGVGHVGSLVAEYARMWGFEVLCCDPPRAAAEGAEGFVGLDEIALKCDIVSFHTPLTREGEHATYHMADDNFFSQLKPEALVLNSSRGEVVDTQALLRSKCDCCIDTWEGEPEIDSELLHRALLATPHIAGYSIQGKANAAAAVVRAVACEFELPLGQWYPPMVVPARPRRIGWQELCATIGNYFDIASESRTLKSEPEKFEYLRDNYRYREEYF